MCLIILLARHCTAIAPSFINVLQVFALSNLHDVSWGTKGSDKADALPSVSSTKYGEAGIVEEAEKTAADLDAAYKSTVRGIHSDFCGKQVCSLFI